MAQTYTVSSPEELRAFTQERQNASDELHIRLKLLEPLGDPDVLRASRMPPQENDRPIRYKHEVHEEYLPLSHVGSLWRNAWPSFIDTVPLASLTFDATRPTFKDEEGKVQEIGVRGGRLWISSDDFQELVLLLATEAKMRAKGDRQFSVEEHTVKDWDNRGRMRQYLEGLSSFRREKAADSR